MFAEVKEMLTFIEPEDESYDAQIISNIKACALDLTRTSEIVLPGKIDITREKVLGKWVITDNSDITDDYVIKTIATWCNKEIGNPPNYENLNLLFVLKSGTSISLFRTARYLPNSLTKAIR